MQTACCFLTAVFPKNLIGCLFCLVAQGRKAIFPIYLAVDVLFPSDHI